MSYKNNKKNDGVMYIYDRVCTKSSKKRELRGEYSNAGRKRRDGARPISRAYQADDFTNTQTTYIPNRSASNRSGGYTSGGKPLKLVLEKIINLVDSIEERGTQDEFIAKRRAISMKKAAEYKHAISTAALLAAITVAFVLVAYKLFFVVKVIDVEGSDAYTVDEVIKAAGVEVGDNLYSFDAGEAERQISFFLPYIKSAKIKRVMPQKLTITVDDDDPIFVADIWGDNVVLSAGLRVLESDTDNTEGLVRLVLPPVDYSVAGSVIRFTDERQQRFIRNTVSELLASEMMMNGLIGRVDLSDEYDIKMVSSDKYLLKFGGDADLDLKLKMVYKTVTSNKFTEGVASIDLSTVGEAYVMYDPNIDLGK